MLRVYRDHLAIEDRGTTAHPSHHFRVFWQALINLVHPPREDSGFSARRPMYLYPRAVELMLECEFWPQHRKCLRDVRGRLRQHRLERLNRTSRCALAFRMIRCFSPSFAERAHHSAEVGLQHVHAPDV